MHTWHLNAYMASPRVISDDVFGLIVRVRDGILRKTAIMRAAFERSGSGRGFRKDTDAFIP
jgi:hypothetical protein